LLEYSTGLKEKSVKIDAGIKAVLALLLAVTSSFCISHLDLVYFFIFLLLITILLKSNLRFVYKNLISYTIIIVFPYFVGLLLSLLVSRLFSGAAYFNTVNLDTAILKMVKIFFIWYIGNLYLSTTPIESIIDMLNKVFSPLNSAGIPAAKYLNMIVFILSELTGLMSRFKNDNLEQARHIFTDNHLGIKSKSKELSNILVTFIANSLQRTDEIYERVELSKNKGCQYILTISKNEIIAIVISVICILFFYGRILFK